MRNRRTPLLTLSVILATLALITQGVPIAYSTPTLSVTPHTNTGAVGDTFSINIYVAGIVDIFGYEFRLWYDTAVLTATKSTPSAVFADVSFNAIDDAEGWVWVSASLPPPLPEDGPDAPLTLVTIEFSVDATGESALDMDETYTFVLDLSGNEYPDDIPMTIEDGFFTPTPPGAHDIAVNSVTASPTKVEPDGSVSIDVTVANEGDFDETFNVTISHDGIIIETRTDVSLAPGDSTTISFTWDTTGLPEGIYEVTAEASVDQDNDLTNNTKRVNITIGAAHDIAVNSVTASPTEVAPGGSVSIDVTVANEGDFDETFNVTASSVGIIIGTQTDVSLAPGDSTTISFTWDTTGLDEGPYLIRAEAIVDQDDNLANNIFDLTDTLVITGGASGAETPDILLYAVAGIAVVIVAAIILVYFLRAKKE